MALIQRAGDREFQWAELHGGKGTITVRRYFEGGFKWPVEFELWEIPVGGSEGVHRHGDDDPDGYHLVDECYLIVQGQGRLIADAEVAEVGPGDAVLVRPETDRGIENIGDEPLRIVVLSGMPSASSAD